MVQWRKAAFVFYLSTAKVKQTSQGCCSPSHCALDSIVDRASYSCLPLPLVLLENDGLQEEGRRQHVKLLISSNYSHPYHLLRAHNKVTTAA